MFYYIIPQLQIMKKISIIIVDEQPLFLKGIRLIFNSFNTIELVGEATNVRTASNLINETKPDVLLLSETLFLSDSTAVIKEIRRHYSELRILLLTMHHNANTIQRGIEAGIDGFLLKSEEPSILEKAIETVVQTGIYFSEDTQKMLSLLRNHQSPNSPSTGSAMPLSLTQRETEILQLICQGYTTSEIANKIYMSSRVVEGHQKNLLEKTGAKNTAGLVMFAIKNKLVEV